MSAVPESQEKEYIIDYGTKNSSFIKMYKVLKEMGIKNNKFFLKLYDPTLRGVNPYSEKLTVEQQARIYQEICRNKWYYLREVIRIPAPGGSIPYELNRGNLALSWAKSMNLNMFLLMPRQNGKTIGAISDDSWTYHFGTTNTDMVYGNKELKDSILNLKRFKTISNLLPEWLKAIIINPRKDTDNETEKRSFRNNNSIKALPSATDVASADKLGRGMTTPIVYVDELAFLKHNKVIYASASPAQSKAAEVAEKMGMPYGKCFTTTPNTLNREEGAFCKKMIEDSCPFDEAMYDWDRPRIKEFIGENSYNDFIHIEFSYKELGLGEEWFKKICRELNNDLLDIKREILLEWPIANDNSPFTEEQLEAVKASVKDPTGKVFLQKNYKMEFFGNIDRERPWLIGVDVAGGLSRDDTVITIADPDTYEIVGVLRSNSIGLRNLGLVLTELVAIYLPNAVVAIERNSYGLGVIDNLMYGPIAKNIYWEMREVQAEKKVREGVVVKQKTKTKVYGINTDKNSRDKMINEILKHIVNEEPHVIKAKTVYEDISTLTYKNSGKIEHQDGKKDDGIFSYLILRYMVGYGTNLARFTVTGGQNRSSGQSAQELKESMNRNMHTIVGLNHDESAFGLSESIIAEQHRRETESRMNSSEKSGFMKILWMNQ